MERQLTEGRPFGVLLRYALPVLGGNLFQLFYTLADTVIVGKALGADALAAVGSTGIISYFVLCFVQGLTGGFGICLGQCCGAGDETGMRRSAAVSWTLSAVFTLLLTPLVCLLARPVLGWMQTPEDIFADAYAYLFVILLGTGATVFYNIISYMLRALGDSRTPLIFLVLSSLLNIGLDILFIVPFHMGVAGAAWATVLSQLLSAILCTIVGLRKYPVLRTRRADFAGSRIAAARHLRVGFLMGFQMSVMCIGQLVVQACVNKLGTAAVAGYTAATKVDQLSVLVNTAYQIAISGYVAQNYGAHRFDRIREGVRASLIQLESVNVLHVRGDAARAARGRVALHRRADRGGHLLCRRVSNRCRAVLRRARASYRLPFRSAEHGQQHRAVSRLRCRAGDAHQRRIGTCACAWLHGRVLLFAACLDRCHGAAHPVLSVRNAQRKDHCRIKEKRMSTMRQSRMEGRSSAVTDFLSEAPPALCRRALQAQ